MRFRALMTLFFALAAEGAVRAQLPAGLEGRLLGDGRQAWEGLQTSLDRWAADEPGLVEKVPIGWSLEDRPIHVLRIGDAKEGAPEVYVGAAVHGDEGSERDAMELVEFLLSHAGTPPFDVLLRSRVIWIQPVINPDGLVARTRWNTRGVDVNRNFGVGWKEAPAGARPGAPALREFPGPWAFSEPETRAVRDFLRSRRHLRACVDVHRSASMVIPPQTGFDEAASAPVRREAVALGAAMGGAWSRPEAARFDQFHGTGTDWAWGERGVMAFTWEIPFLPPGSASPDDPRVRGLLRLLARCAEYPPARAAGDEAVPPSSGGEVPDSPGVSPESVERLCGESWTGIWHKGRKVGGSRGVRRIENRGGRLVFVDREDEITFSPAGSGQKSRRVHRTEHEMKPPQDLVRDGTWEELGGVTEARTCTETEFYDERGVWWRRNASWVFDARSGVIAGSVTSRSARTDAVRLPLRKAFDFILWLRELPHDRGRTSFTTRSPETGENEEILMAYVRSIPAAPPRRPLLIHEFNQHIISNFYVDSEGRVCGWGLDGPRPDGPATALTAFGPDGFLASMVDAPPGLGSDRDAAELVLETDARWRPIFDTGAAQRVEDVEGKPRCHIRILAEPDPSPAIDAERARFLRPSDGIPSDDAGIRWAAARHAAGGDVRAKAASLAAWVARNIVSDGRPWIPGRDAAETLGEAQGDAEDRVLLFTALARAAGIPARPVRGLVHLGDRESAFGPHSWAEVLLESGAWMDVDPSPGCAAAYPLRIRCRPAPPELLATLRPGEAPELTRP